MFYGKESGYSRYKSKLFSTRNWLSFIETVSLTAET
jgi:hypothetical protein